MANIPSYPVVEVTVRDDGSAHVNIAGAHFDLPAGDLADTRREILTHATDLAKQLGRPVRMRATDPTGTWLQAVDIDGNVIDLTPAVTKKRAKLAPLAPRATKPSRTTNVGLAPAPPARDTTVQSPADATTIPAVSHAAPLTPDTEHTRIARRNTRARQAILRFNTGNVETITGAAIIGRSPTVPDGDNARPISIYDPTLTLSKTHVRLEVTAAGVTVIDLGSANGTYLAIDGVETELTAGVPYPAEDGASLELGTSVVVTISLAA